MSKGTRTIDRDAMFNAIVEHGPVGKTRLASILLGAPNRGPKGILVAVLALERAGRIRKIGRAGYVAADASPGSETPPFRGPQ